MTDVTGATGATHVDEARLRRRPGTKWHRAAPDVLAAWVADMDFDPPPAVRRALEGRLAVGDLGYPEWVGAGPLADAFAVRMADRYGWSPDPAHVRGFTDVVQALQVVLHLGTRPGDGVALHVPTYPPFLASLAAMGRRLVGVPVARGPGEGGDWSVDAERLERDVTAARCTTLVLVHPHNPTGRSWTRAELAALADVARRHDLLVVADEIHADLTWAPHGHVPFASLDDDAAARTVTLTSATKAFNLAAVRCTVAHVGPPALRAALAAHPPQLFGELSPLGVDATIAAWTHGEEWLQEVRSVLAANLDRVGAVLAERLPAVGYRRPDATYLAWLDLRALGLGADPAAFLHRRARVLLSSGPDFGPGGDGHARLNVATSPALLDAVLDRIVTALAG